MHERDAHSNWATSIICFPIRNWTANLAVKRMECVFKWPFINQRVAGTRVLAINQIMQLEERWSVDRNVDRKYFLIWKHVFSKRKVLFDDSITPGCASRSFAAAVAISFKLAAF